MPLKSILVSCAWPACHAESTLAYSVADGQFVLKGWRNHGNVFSDFLCPVHAAKSGDEFRRLKDRIADAGIIAQAIVAGVAHETDVPAARAAFLAICPGCERLWADAARGLST